MATGYAEARKMEFVERKESTPQVNGADMALAGLMLPTAIVAAYFFIRVVLAVLS